MIHEKIKIKLKDGRADTLHTVDGVYAVLTVEERRDGLFYSSTYYPSIESKSADGGCFETLSGALVDMYRNAIAILSAQNESHEIEATENEI
jgi:hypothetical protein